MKAQIINLVIAKIKICEYSIGIVQLDLVQCTATAHQLYTCAHNNIHGRKHACRFQLFLVLYKMVSIHQNKQTQSIKPETRWVLCKRRPFGNSMV